MRRKIGWPSSKWLVEEMGTKGEGAKFYCKLVGMTDVVGPEGEDMCAEAFRKLKAQAKKKKQRKERVTVTVSLEGVRIEDDTTQEVVHMHPVKRISFVYPDPDDKNIFGYVCSQPNCSTGYIFYALKSENALTIIDAIIEIFDVSANFRHRAESAEKQVPNNSSNENPTQIQEMRTRLTNLREQLREKDHQLQEKEWKNRNLQTLLNSKNQQLEEKIRQLREAGEQMTKCQAQLRNTELEKVNLLTESNRQNENLRVMYEQLANAQSQLRDEELLKTNMQEELERKEHQLVDSELRLREVNQQLRNLQDQIREKDRTTSDLQERLEVNVRRVGELEEQLTTKDQEKNEIERSLSTAQQELRDNQAQRSPDWVIPRYQIQLTDKILGRGAWGEVVEGEFCGCVVAVKTIYDVILSPHNRRLFEREMDIASRCRHPCLLQFIGATNDDQTPLFVTELMETSLRALLQQRYLSQEEISVIALDVARGLNYLHQKQPIPILHRDISSANVLLWRHGDQWRAKVADYGTANFKQQIMTVTPGASTVYLKPALQIKQSRLMSTVLGYFFARCPSVNYQIPTDENNRSQW